MKVIVKYSLILLIGMIMISSCKTIKKNRGKKDVLTLEQIYDSIYKFQYDYNTLYAKCNVKVKRKNTNLTVKGNLKILKDSMIWISLNTLGIEVVRLKCTKDSVYLLDKINKSLTKGKYDYINKLWKIEVDYNSLQSILTNRFFIYPTVVDEKKDFFKQFSIKNDSSQIVAFRKTDESVENVLKLNNSNFHIVSYLINDVPNVRSLKIDYTDGTFENAPNFPGGVEIASTNSGKNIGLNVNYTRVTLNTSITFPFKVPKTYRVIVH